MGRYKVFNNVCNEEFVGYFKKNLVSCVLLTYFQPSKCIRAIESFIAQDYQNKELIIINSGDTSYFDEIEDFLRKRGNNRIKHILVRIEPKSSVGELRNYALKLCSGEFVCIWDDDDFSRVDRLTYQVNELKRMEEQNVRNGYSLLSNFFVEFESHFKKKSSVKKGLNGTLLFRNNLLVGKVILFNDEVQKDEYDLFFEGLESIGYERFVLNNDEKLFYFGRSEFNLQRGAYFEKILAEENQIKQKKFEKSDDFILECEKKLQSLQKDY